MPLERCFARLFDMAISVDYGKDWYEQQKKLCKALEINPDETEYISAHMEPEQDYVLVKWTGMRKMTNEEFQQVFG